jgi:hypothetical protein
MSIWDDTPETEPKIKSTLPRKYDTVRAMRSSLGYQKVREECRRRLKTDPVSTPEF